MREINVREISDAVRILSIKTNSILPEDVRKCIESSIVKETSDVAVNVLETIKENIKIADEGVFPLCQDTGMACVFIEIGQDVHLMGGNLEDAINDGVRRGYVEGYLRKSIVEDPLRRKNTGDNTPASVTYRIVPGEKVKIIFAPKGFGSENMSRIAMLAPSAGEQGVKDFVLETCRKAGANPCPPIVVGIGIGGTFDKAALMAKEALLKPLDEKNADPYYADMEDDLLKKINFIGIGPQGFGGNTTALAVKINVAPTHIAGLPVAVNINCHVSRHAEVVI